MKKFLNVLLLCAVVAIGIPATVTVSQPVEAQSYTYYCEAHSRSAMGYWYSNSLASAKRNALLECSKRTPSNQVCRIIHTPYCPY